MLTNDKALLADDKSPLARALLYFVLFVHVHNNV